MDNAQRRYEFVVLALTTMSLAVLQGEVLGAALGESCLVVPPVCALAPGELLANCALKKGSCGTDCDGTNVSCTKSGGGLFPGCRRDGSNCVARRSSPTNRAKCQCQCTSGVQCPSGTHCCPSTSRCCGTICCAPGQICVGGACRNRDGTAVEDPHLRGFDGQKFDFHGTDGGLYNVFSTRQGDTFVAKIRQMEGVASHTYFHEVGVHLTGAPQIRVFLRLHSDNSASMAVEVNDKEITNNTEFAGVHVEFSNQIVRVFNDKYAFVCRQRTRVYEERHIDIKVELEQAPSAKESFDGILGVTLNHALGKTVQRSLLSENKHEREMANRAAFQVDSLFPAVKRIAVTRRFTASSPPRRQVHLQHFVAGHVQ